MSVKIHTAKDALWQNAAGDAVPYKFVPASDRVKECKAGEILKAALKVEAELEKLHVHMNDCCKAVSATVKKEYAIANGKEKKEGKGSFTWYSFDKSVKVEADINDIVKWDGALMTEALQLLNKYMDGSLSDANLLIKQLVSDGFSNSKGMIDSRRIFQLLKYESKIKDQRFLKACELIKQAQSIDTTKLYMRVWVKTDDGSYRNINLNFSTL